jgi:hypothetical protein
VHRSVVFVSVEPGLTGKVIFTVFLVAKAVITLSLLRVTQDLIGFRELLEILSSLFIVWVLIWVLQECEFTVSFLNLLNCSSLGYTQDIIKNELFLLVTPHVVIGTSFFDLLFFLLLTIGFEAIILLLLLVFAGGIFLHFN